MLHNKRVSGLVGVSPPRMIVSRFMKADGGGVAAIAAVALPVVIGAAVLCARDGLGAGCVGDQMTFAFRGTGVVSSDRCGGVACG